MAKKKHPTDLAYGRPGCQVCKVAQLKKPYVVCGPCADMLVAMAGPYREPNNKQLSFSQEYRREKK